GLAALVGFVVGAHFMLRWLIASTAPPAAAHLWSWRSTITVSLILLLMFAAGTAMVGATHQLVWMAMGRAGEVAKGKAVFASSNSVRAAAHRVQESNHLKQIGLGIQNFHDTYAALPPGGTMTETGELLHGWAISIGPFVNFWAEGLDDSVPWNQAP